MDIPEKIRGVDGRLLGFVLKGKNRDIVCDRNGRQLGYCTDKDTLKVTGKRLALGSQPALLFQKERGK